MEDKTIINPSELSKALAIPTFVTPQIIEEGKEIVRPDVINAVTQFAILGQMTKIRKSLDRQNFEGVEDPRTLNATDQLQWLDLINLHPNTPWINAFFINHGPDEVMIGLNQPDKMFTMLPGSTRTVTHTGAEERIRIIYYQCHTGETALVTVTGSY